jgi:hypothetical protein
MSSQQSGTVSVEIESKFTEGYRTGTDALLSAPLWTTVTNPDGSQDLIAIDSDHETIRWLQADSTSETGYTVKTFHRIFHEKAGIVALQAFYDSAGRLTVIMSTRGTLYTYYPDKNEWIHIKSAKNPPELPDNANSPIVSIHVTSLGGKTYVGIVHKPSTTTFLFTCWDDAPNDYTMVTLSFFTHNSFWIENTDGSISFVSMGQSTTFYNIADDSYFMILYAQLSVDPIRVACVTLGPGYNYTFLINRSFETTESKLYADIYAVDSINNESKNVGSTWLKLTSRIYFKELYAKADEIGMIHLFAISAENKLYHLRFVLDDPKSTSAAIPILTDITSCDIPVTGTDVEVLSLSPTQNNSSFTVTDIYLEDTSGNWGVENIKLTDESNVENFITYSSDITVYDSTGTILPNTSVVIEATDQTVVIANGKTYTGSPAHLINTTTNAAGMLSIYQETASLAVPPLNFRFPDVQGSDYIFLDQAAIVQQELSTVNGTDIYDAKDAEGNYLLTGNYHEQTTADSVAHGLHECMNLKPGRPGRPLRTKSGRTSPAAWRHESNDLTGINRVKGEGENYGFQLFFENDSLRFERLSAAEAVAIANTIRTTNDISDWFSSIGDLVKSAANGLTRIVKTVVTIVDGAIQATITFIVDGAVYIFEHVIETMEDLFDLAEAIFAKVKVVFEKIWEWIGFLFDWDDILRTHEVISYFIGQYVGFLSGAMTHIQQFVDSGISNLQANLKSITEKGDSDFGDHSIGSYSGSFSQPSDSYYSSTANNIAYNGLMNHFSPATASMQGVANPKSDPGPFDQFMQQLQAFATNAQAQPAYANISPYYVQLGQSPDQLFSQGLKALLDIASALAGAVLSGVQTVVDGLFQLGQTLIDAMKAFLAQPLKIPFVTSFYSFITKGSTLTIGDLVALIVATPATIFYKLVYNKAPFPDDQSVTAFKSQYTTQWMLQSAGYADATDAKEGLPEDDGSGLSGMLSIISGMATVFYGFVSAAIDGESIVKIKHPGSKFAFSLEIILQAFSFPWFTSSGAPSCDIADPDGTAQTMWLIQNIGILIDGFVVKKEEGMTEEEEDASVIAGFVYSTVHLAMAIKASWSAPAANGAANILPVIPELCKFLKLSTFKADKRTVIVLAAADALCYTFAGVCIIVAGLHSSEIQIASSPQPARIENN